MDQMKLLALNKKRGFLRAEHSPNEATIYLYDVIVDSDADAEWWGGVSAESFVKMVREVTAPVLHLRVNTPGGSVFAGRAMEQALRDFKGKIITHIDGVAASAGSFVILPSDEIVIAPGAFVMIHKGMLCVCGNADDLARGVDLLNQVDQSLVKSYAARTGQSEEDIQAWMAAETWFVADKAVELGFADRVATDASPEALAKPWDLSAYANAPDQLTAMASPEPVPPAPAPEPEIEQPARPCQMDTLRALIPA